eukprot:2364472-Rhodomonas_salina.2
MSVSRAAPLGSYTGKQCFLQSRGGCTSPAARASLPGAPTVPSQTYRHHGLSSLEDSEVLQTTSATDSGVPTGQP